MENQDQAGASTGGTAEDPGTATADPGDVDGTVVSGVGLTALNIAAARAIETSHRDGLIDDPLAEHFVRAAAAHVPLPTRIEEVADGDRDPVWGRAGRYFGLRTRVFDDYVRAAADAGIRQFVLLAAGLDSRAFRLGLPGDGDLYEIDRGPVLAFKQQVLDAVGAEPTVRRHTIAADLAGPWPEPLRAAGFDPARPTAWLAEGLLPYLPAEVETRLLETVVELSAPGSRIALELVLAHTTDEVRQDPILVEGRKKFGVDMGALFSKEERRDPVDWLVGRGWAMTSASAFHHQARYGRGPGADTGDATSRARFCTGWRP
jgi:methyltransferase (TIGR00027 family)